jgi:translation initiation factor IF-2
MAESKGNRPNRPVRPRQAPGGRKRRVIIDTGAARPRQDSRQARDRQEPRPKAPPGPQPTGPVTVPSGVSVKDLSQALGVAAAQIIKIMMGLGEMVTITQSLSDEAVQLIANEVKREVSIKHVAEEDELPEVYEDAEEDLVARPPVVTIMGHVDHGKTTLLDAIREASVVETEAGGITQHIGAYQAQHDGRKITFLDTPGHEAFTAMRARGAKVTDIAVLVVAADDGVKPQTQESIAHARAAEVPIVVAVNKVDKPDADPQRVRQELVNEDLQPEEWGGSTQFSDVSAKEKQNLDDLLEKVLLVADAELELTANPKAEASGPIIESRLDVGRGPVATMLVQRGTLRVGDPIVAGDAWGKVRALHTYRGEKVNEAGPGDPIEIIGFDDGCLADRVKERRLAVIDMAHDRDHRGPCDEILLGVLVDLGILVLLRDVLDRHVALDLGGDERHSLVRERLRDRHHRAQAHQDLDELCRRHSERLRQILDRYARVDGDRPGRLRTGRRLRTGLRAVTSLSRVLPAAVRA